MRVPSLRIRTANQAPVRPGGDYVLYWMIAARRASWSFALDRAVELCRELGKPLLVLEPLRAGHEWASDRLHAFVLQGLADNAAAFARAGVGYHPYVERRPGEGRGLLAALAARACAVVTDDFPAYFLPRMVAAAAARVPVRLEAVDGNGLLPIEAIPRAVLTAHAFRRLAQRLLPGHLAAAPGARPLLRPGLAGARLPPGVLRRWPRASAALLRAEPGALARLAIDHGVPPVACRGGSEAARTALRTFARRGLAGYAEARRHPDLGGTSGLSGWLHFGHLSAHEVFAAVARAERWTPAALGRRRDGGREGYWGMSSPAEAFLDQVIVWRELALGFSAHRPGADEYGGLPPWALTTLARHAADPRPVRYRLEELEAAATHDPLWNAAQRQLLAEGRIHGQLRMLWGKKILEWSASPEEAWGALVALNDRWALDGRDPSSYAGLGWCLGRFDRPWGPERPIFGTVRYMSSSSALAKLRVKAYLARWGARAGSGAP